MNGYDLTRHWFDFKFENPDKCNSFHSELFMYTVDLWNRFGQKEKFGLPTAHTMETLGIGSKKKYLKTFNDLVDFGFIKVVSDSKNQYQSRIIAIVKKTPAKTSALSTALTLASTPALTPIDKQLNKEQKNKEQIVFDIFWSMYNKKHDTKKCRAKWDKLSNNVREQIIKHVPLYVASTPDKQFRKNPETYLNNECWNDDVHETKAQPEQKIKTRNDFYDEPSYQYYCQKNKITPEP